MLYIYYTFCPYDKFDRQKNFNTMSTYRKKLLDYVFTKHIGKNFDANDLVKNKYGKPYFIDSSFYFNISHTKGLICCGISNTEIGIDCEHICEFNNFLIDKVCTLSEKNSILQNADINRVFFTYWTLKESYCKFTGKGLCENLKNIEFTIQNQRAFSNCENVYFSYKYIDDFVISLCSEDKYLYCRHEYCELEIV